MSNHEHQHYIERLAAIDKLDDQMELVEPLANQLLDDATTRTPEIAEAILRMYERNPEADGFGTYSTFNMVLEELDAEVLRPLVKESLARKETWAARELADI